MKLKACLLYFTIAISFVLLFSPNSLAQNQKASINFTHPIPIGNSLYSDFDGIINSNFKYSRLIGSNVYLNGQFDFTYSERIFPTPYPNNTYLNIYKFILSSEVAQNIGSLFIVKPEWGIGYSFLDYKRENRDFNETRNGITTRFALHIDKKIIENISIGAISSYDIMFLNKSEGSENSSYERVFHSVNIGIIGTLNF